MTVLRDHEVVAKSWHAFRRFRCHSNDLHGHSKHPDDEVRRKIMSRLHFRVHDASTQSKQLPNDFSLADGQTRSRLKGEMIGRDHSTELGQFSLVKKLFLFFCRASSSLISPSRTAVFLFLSVASALGKKSRNGCPLVVS